MYGGTTNCVCIYLLMYVCKYYLSRIYLQPGIWDYVGKYDSGLRHCTTICLVEVRGFFYLYYCKSTYTYLPRYIPTYTCTYVGYYS